MMKKTDPGPHPSVPIKKIMGGLSNEERVLVGIDVLPVKK